MNSREDPRPPFLVSILTRFKKHVSYKKEEEG